MDGRGGERRKEIKKGRMGRGRKEKINSNRKEAL